MKDLSFPLSLDPVVLSEEEGIEKPSREIFDRVLWYVNQNQSPEKGRIETEECLHVGDELEWYVLQLLLPNFEFDKYWHAVIIEARYAVDGKRFWLGGKEWRG